MEQVSYFGVREQGSALVFRYGPGRDPDQGVPLPLRLDLRKHSPAGPDWGYAGNGSAQLALAILADCLGDDEEALEFYQEFKATIIARLPEARWSLNEQDIDRALAALRRRELRAR